MKVIKDSIESNRPKKKYGILKGCLTIIIVFLIICIGISITISLTIDKVTSPKSEITKYIDVPDEQASDIEKILSDCGIGNISNIEHDKLLDNAHEKGETGYRITTDIVDNVILYLNANNKVKLVKYADYKLYNKGKVRSNLQDHVVDMDEVNSLMTQCEQAVKGVLKSPKTAKFPSYTEWGFAQKKKNIYLVSGYVDAKNSFGVEIRSDFSFKIKNSKIVSFVFDGKELIK